MAIFTVSLLSGAEECFGSLVLTDKVSPMWYLLLSELFLNYSFYAAKKVRNPVLGPLIRVGLDDMAEKCVMI